MKITTKNVSARLVTFRMLKTYFQKQVKLAPANGQRNHEEQNRRGRAHITGSAESRPTTQCIMHAVSFKGIRKQLLLIDGYHRLSAWFDAGWMPFDSVLLITHTVEASSAEEAILKTDSLQRSIDSREAVKGNADYWSAAIRDAGVVAVSGVYALGRGASFFSRVIGPAKNSILDLKKRVERDVGAHILMDKTYFHAEKHLSREEISQYFHPGVAVALFKHLQTLDADSQMSFVQVFQGALRNCVSDDAAKTSTKQSEAIARILMELAEPGIVRSMKGACKNREQYYDAVHEQLKVAFNRPMPKAKKLKAVV